MRILLVSMNSIHFRRWSEQLRDSGHDVYWFDILDQGYAPSISWINQITGWKKGFLKKRGRTFIKNRWPKLYTSLVNKYDTKVEEAFAKSVQEIQPDAIHSFALYVSCTPILPVMLQNNIPWVYSSWGSDLFYFRKDSSHLNDIKKVLPRINYMFADCKRDQEIATELGFIGTHLGVFPGGGGFDLEAFKAYQIPQSQRKIIAVKGNENRSGRAVPVLKALEQLSLQLTDFEVVVFGVENKAIFQFQEGRRIPHLTIKGLMEHEELIQLFCSSLIYIGNSNSDGMPNTLLEAICAGAFPIQSNPGDATEELIENEKNGLLIDDCEDVELVKGIIKKALTSPELVISAVQINNKQIVPGLDMKIVQQDVINAYESLKSRKV